jgi:hypothetical protein
MDTALERWDATNNWRQYTVNDEPVVDAVYDYASLLDGVTRSCAIAGIDFDGWLPRAKADTGRASIPYHEVLEPKHVEAIGERCAKEIAFMSFQF